MRWRTSLKRRTLGAAILTMAVCIPLIAWALESAFATSLTQALFEQMRIQSLTLISEFDYRNGEIDMPEHLDSESFNLPESGLYAFITVGDDLSWQSESSTLMSPATLYSPPVGQFSFERTETEGHDYFRFAYTAEFETEGDFKAVGFHVLQDADTFQLELDEFRWILWYWLSFITLLLFALLVFSLNQALKPIGNLIRQIERVEQGDQGRIERHYPKELELLKDRINQLLDNESQQRERYKNSLSDLAHSLKTPLAVLKGDTHLPDSAKAPIEELENRISRQLKRAVKHSDDNWAATTTLATVLPQLRSAMKKIYADKRLSIEFDSDLSYHCSMDQTDLTEVLGNLLDNACKAATSKIRISAQDHKSHLTLLIDDDGLGVPKAERHRLLARGARLDSYHEGQGIGLTVVLDILAAYQGQLEIKDSPLGGARMSITLPHQYHHYNLSP